MKNSTTIAFAVSMLCAACGGTKDATASTTSTSASSGGGAENENVRGTRYCEILPGFLAGVDVTVDIHNTIDLNACPEDAWTAVDPAQVKKDLGAEVVTLNGPRNWVADSFPELTFVDPTPAIIGGIEMREIAQIHLKVVDAMKSGDPYAPLVINRNMTSVFDAGKAVYELADPNGHVYTMQSYSQEIAPLTEADLPGLAAKLTLPKGWMYRSRVLTEQLSEPDVNGVATVVNDDLDNTYQLSQE